MKRLIFALGLLGIMSLPASPAAAAMVYDVSFSDPNLLGPGNLTVTGTITVDTLGMLSASDIVNFSLTITSARNPPGLITPMTGTISTMNNPVFTATAASLSITLPPTMSGAGTFIDFSTNSGSSFLGISNGGGVGPARTMVNGQAPPPATEDLSTVIFGPASGGTFVIATAAVASVPEPASLVMACTAGLFGIGCWLRRRQRSAA